NILILDEPTVGLDVKTRAFIIDKLKSLNKTIFLTSHDMGIVERLCNRIAFINKGKIVKIGTKEDIKKLEKVAIIMKIRINDGKDELEKELNRESFVVDINEKNSSLYITLKNRDYLKDLLLILGRYHVLSLNEELLSLEDLFMKLS
ncbi:MAG: ATP-binding protein DrrA1-3 family domain-containing protein, partial [Candidatus Helarchaeota archaeon]